MRKFNPLKPSDFNKSGNIIDLNSVRMNQVPINFVWRQP